MIMDRRGLMKQKRDALMGEGGTEEEKKLREPRPKRVISHGVKETRGDRFLCCVCVCLL